MAPASSHERPLNKTARITLVGSAALTIGLFYVFVTLAALLLLTWIGLELLLAVGLARFGIAGLISPDIGRNVQLMKLLVASLWLRRSTSFRLVLQEAKAPGIFAISKALAARLQIPPPDKFYIEMGAGAWVELRGLRQNMGTTHVGLGYDLLAGLNTKEIEAVLAHELAHAKLINRTFKRWLNYGLSRAINLTGQLAATVDRARQQKKGFYLAQQLFTASDRLARMCSRLIATYSRQDEFDADRGAAELCGAAPLKSSLLKLELLEPKLARLPWNERMAQIQSDDGLSQWLVTELNVPQTVTETARSNVPVVNPYSTHPSTHDRLTALGDDAPVTFQESLSGITLLSEPDEIARNLAEEIERQMLIEENRDEKALRAWLKKTRRAAKLRLADWPALITGIGTIIVIIVALSEDMALSALASLVVGAAVTFLLKRVFHYRDREVLPVPEYSLIYPGKKTAAEVGTMEERQKEMEKSTEEKLAGTGSKKRNAVVLSKDAYQALAKGDYLQAHVAARLCLKRASTSVEGMIALAVASAALGQAEQSQSLLTNLLQRTTLRSRSTRWGTAWALALSGEFMPAEALLHELVRDEENSTFTALLGHCQHQRGKLRSAITNARKAVGSNTTGTVAHRQLIRALLDHGNLKEAEKQLTLCEAAAETEQLLQFGWLRLRLLQRRLDEADVWVRRIDKGDTASGALIMLGGLFENAREDSRAAQYYERARSVGQNPEACVGLARLAARSNDTQRAIALAKMAIDLTKPAHEDSRPAIAVFAEVLGLLWSFREPEAGSKAWVGLLPSAKTIEPFSDQKVLIYATAEKEARAYLEEIFSAFLPGQAQSLPLRYGVDLAPDYFQPVGLVRPGVQRFYH